MRQLRPPASTSSTQAGTSSLSTGGFVVSWQDYIGQGDDASDSSVKARIFSLIDEVNKISGTTGNDTLVGTEGADLIRALAGDDTLLSNFGGDALHGG